MRILGIDPGLSGGAAVLIVNGAGSEIAGAIDIPTTGKEAKRRVDSAALHKWIIEQEPDVAFIERAGVMPRQGNASGFIYGRAVGAIEATVTLAGVPLHVIEPQTWKRHFDLPGGDKEAARQAVLALFPQTKSLIPRKKHHNRAEAILVAMYGADHTREYVDEHEYGSNNQYHSAEASSRRA